MLLAESQEQEEARRGLVIAAAVSAAGMALFALCWIFAKASGG